MITYPKLKPEQKRGNRLDPQKIIQIKEMFASGENITQISIKLEINWHTVKRHIDPEYRKKTNKYSKKYILKKYHTNPDFKKNMNDIRRKNYQIQIKVIPELKEYNRKKSEEFRKASVL